MVVEGHVINGAIVLDGGIVLPEGATVHVTVATKPAPAAPSDDVPTLYQRLQDVVGVVDDLPADSSTNLDQYLYGASQ